MSVRRLVTVAAVVVWGGIGLAGPAAAHASVRPVAAGLYDFGPGRLGATTGAVLGLAGVVVAVLVLARPAGRPGAAAGRSRKAVVAMVAGVTGMGLGGLVAATADGGLGTGNGLGGAYVAMLTGLAGVALGGLALARSRRTG
ncbi:DUF6223 family protein [Streptomyces sp. NPDC017254]|uniref:DUF6223 family protein n=1 Tax=unclassified Streptomyces TaxID=2593676 RepID=UPI00379EEFCE